MIIYRPKSTYINEVNFYNTMYYIFFQIFTVKKLSLVFMAMFFTYVQSSDTCEDSECTQEALHSNFLEAYNATYYSTVPSFPCGEGHCFYQSTSSGYACQEQTYLNISNTRIPHSIRVVECEQKEIQVGDKTYKCEPRMDNMQLQKRGPCTNGTYELVTVNLKHQVACVAVAKM